MRWFRKKQPKPYKGDTRVIRVFLWNTYTIQGEVRWFEHANILQRFDDQFEDEESIMWTGGAWFDVCWTNAPVGYVPAPDVGPVPLLLPIGGSKVLPPRGSHQTDPFESQDGVNPPKSRPTRPDHARYKAHLTQIGGFKAKGSSRYG